MNYLISIRSEIRDDPKLFTIKLNLLFSSSKPQIDPSLLASVLYPLILSSKSLHQRVSYLQLFGKMPYHPAAETEVLQVSNDTFKAFMETKGTVSPLLVQQWRLLMPLFFAAMAHTFTHQQEFRDTLYLFMSTPLCLAEADGTFTPLTDVLRNINKKIFASMNTPEKLSLLRALLSVVPNHPSVDAVDVYNSINELDLSVAAVNDLYRKRRHHRFNLFRQIAIHAYIMKKLSVLSADYKKWRAGLSIEPEFMAVGPLPFGCLALLSKYPAFDSVEAISAIPQTTSSLVELSRSLSSQSQEAIAKMPGMDQQLAPVIAAGAMVLRCTLEMTGSYEFRVTPYGICAGILRSPSYLFTQPGQ